MSAKWWAVYRGGEYIEHVQAVSGERALDVVSERESIPLAELDAEEFDVPEMELPLTPKLLQFDHDRLERSGLGMLPFYSMELGPEFSEPVPAVPGKEVV
jgi:hypothetical protein